MAKSKEWLIDSINRGIEENKKQGTYNYVSKKPAYKSGRNPLSQSQATKVSYDENGKMKISLVPGGAAAVRDLARQQLGMKSSTINGEETRYDYQGAVNKLGYNNVVNAVDSLVNREHMKDTAIEREIWQQANGVTGMGTPRFDDPDDYTPVISYLDTQIENYKKTGASSNPLITAIQQASERAYGNGGAKSIKLKSGILTTLEQQRTALGQKQDNLYAAKVLNEIKNNKDEDLFARLQNIDTVINSTKLYKWSDQYKTMGSGVEERKAERENIIKVLREKGYSDPELYLKYYSKIMNNKAAKDLNEDIDKFVKDHSVVGPAAATAYAVATAGASGITKLAGKAFGDTGFNALHLVGSAGTAMTESVTRNIQANNPGTKGKVFSFLYNAGVSALESASIMGTLGGGIGEAIMGLNAAMDTYDEARAKGVDGVNAFASAFAAGVFEAVFEHVGWDKISFLASSGKGGLAAGIKDVLVSMGTEGAEEVLTDMANELADYLINGGLSEYELAKASGMSDGEYAKQLGLQLLESFAAGAVSGGMMYGSARAGRAIGNKVTGAVSNAVAGSDVQRTGSTQDLISEATLYPQEEIQLDSLHLRQQQAKTAEAKNKVSQKISELRETYKAGKLYNAIDAQNVRSAVSSRIDTVNSGLDEQTRKNIADGIAEAMKGKTLTEAQAAAINTETGRQILDEVINNDPWVQEMNVGRLKTQATAGLTEARAERAMNMPVGTLNARRQYDDALKEKTGEITKAIRSDDGVSLVNNMGELGGIKAVSETGIEVVIDKDTGATSAYSDMKSSDADVDMIYDTAGMEVHGTVPVDTLKAFGATVQLNSGAKMSLAAANVQIGLYDKTVNADTGAYLALTYEAYKAGLSGMTFENYMNHHSSAELEDTVTEGQLREMYHMGAADHGVKPGVTRIGTKTLTQTELDTLTVLDEFFKGKGRSVFVVDELTEDNAYYVAGKDTIVLALNAEGGLLTTAAFHELLHQTVNELGKTEGDKLVDAIIDVLRMSVGEEKLDEIYSEKKRQYEDIIAEMPYAKQFEYIKEEIAAQYFGSIASVNEDYLANHMQKDMSFWQKIMDKFRKILDDIREKAKAFADRDLIVASALKTEDDKAQKVLEMFEKAFEMAKVSAEKKENAGEQSGGERYSIKTSADGEKYVEVAPNEIDLNNGRSIASNIAEIIKNKFNNLIHINGQTFRINSSTNREWRKSNSARKLENSNPVAYTDKIKSIANADEIIKVAKDWIAEERRPDSKYAEYARGYVLFKVGTNGYAADVIVGISNFDKSATLYDLVNILEKVITEAPLSSSAKSLTSRLGTSVIDNTISYDSDKSKMFSRKIIADSDGNKLSEQQQDFFKDSKVVDENGRLLVMYHGTPNAGFTEFKPGTYFTQNKEYADKYQGQGASSLGYKKTADNPDTYKVYLNITKPFDTRNKAERDIFNNEYYRKWGTGTPLMESGLPDWLDGMDLQEFLEENGYDYDGLVLDEGGTGGYGDEVKSRGISYVVFDSSQVKDVTNKTPTKSKDYRYSKKNKIEKPKKKAYNETETNFMIWSKSESSELGSYRGFKRFGRFRYYKKSEDGVIEVTRKEYDEERQKRRDSHYGQARDNVYGTSDQVRLESGGYHGDRGVSGHSGENIEIARRDGGEQLQNEFSGNIKRDRENTGGLPDGGVKPSRRIRTTAEIISELGEKNEVLDEALRTTKRELKKVRAEAVKAKLDMTETGGTIPKRGVITNIVEKHNDANLTGISNREFGDHIFNLFREYANGEGSSDALVNAVLDVMYDKAANSEETLENENRIAIREYVAGKKFYVDDVTWRQLTENSGSRGALNAAYKNTFGFTLAPSSEMKDGKGSSWSDTAAELADQIGYVFSGSTYEDNAREGASYEVAAALYEKAASGAMSDLVHTVFGTTEDAYNAAKIETMDMVTELLRASTLRTKADRYVDQMERIKERYLKKAEKREAKIREIIDKLKAEKAELKTNMAGELKEQKQKTADLRTEKNLRYEAMRRYYIDRNREAVQQRNDTKRRAAARKNITKTVKWLNDRFVNETDTKNIPERMKSIVAPFLQVFLDEETTPGGNTTIFRYEQLNRLAEFYDRFNDNVDPDEIPQDLVPLLGLFDEDVAVTLRNLRDTVAGRRLSDLTLAELEDVKKVMTNLRHIVQNAGAAFVNGRKVMIADAGDEMIRHAQDHKLSLSQKAEQIPLIGKKIKGANAYLNTSMLKPVYFFKEKLGGTIGQFFDGIREGQNTWYFRVADAKDFFEETKERFNYNDWKKDAHHFTTERGDRLSLDVEAIMQLYATYNRERLNTTDTNHILEGGIVLGEKLAENQKALDKKADAKRSAEEYADNSRIRLSVADIENIISVLSEEQIGYADAVVDYLSTTCAEWGNEASMQLFGIRKYTEQYYFPFQSADNFLYTRFGQQQEARLKHVGFTNRLQHGANNPLIISSLSEVAAGHASQMASYSSLAVPIENMQRLYNYKNNDTTVKSEIENAYGSSAKAYLNTFMSDINGGVRNDRIGGIFNNMVGKFKRAAVMLNMSVVVQQPSAVTRAMAMVDPKYFVRSTFRYADYDELLKYSGVAGVKSIGGFDTGTGTGTISFITGENSISEKLGNVTGFLAEKADAITWSHIWNAVKRETAAKMGIKYHSDMPEDFYAEAAKRFNDVVDYTQVYDSVLSRSEVMRSKDNLAKMVSAFMAEPTTTYNMLVASGKNKSIGKAAAITAFIMNVVLNTALKDLVAAWRDDSDKSYWERYVNHFFGDIFGSPEAFHLDSEFSMIGMIPWVKDILSLLSGYDVERSDITALEEIVDVIGQLRDFLGKEDITDQDIKELLFAAVVAISDLTGLPLKSVSRDINGLKAQLERSKNADYHTTLDTIKREIAAAWAGDPKKRESIYQAVLNGDEETIRRNLTPSAEEVQKIKDANGWTEEQAKAQAEADAADKFHAAVREALKENDDRILEAAQARYDGKISVYADIAQEIIDEGIFDRDDILAAISSEFNKIKNAEADEYEDPEAKDVAMFVKSDFIAAMIGGDADTAEAARNEIIRSAVANGKTEEQAAKSFKDAVTKSAKEMFFADEISKKQALGILQEAGVKKSDAAGKVDWWSWDKEYGQTYPDIDQTTYNAWVNMGLESKGISFDIWATYKTECQKLRGGTGKTVTKDQKMVIINGMDLTNAQKDVLYYSEDWADSKIYEAPWH